MMQLCVLVLAVALGGLLLMPGPSEAVTCPTTSTADADLDGFTDAQECNGITTLGVTPLSVPSCTVADLQDPALRKNCLDPNSKDLFVILVKAASSNLDAYLGTTDPLAVLRKTLQEGGLGITIHQITNDNAVNTPSSTTTDRRVVATTNATTFQKALRITESLATSQTATGTCTQGTPNKLDRCIVYTQKIVNVVNGTCAGKTCVLSPVGLALNADPVGNVIANYFQDTIAHELSHSLSLAPTYNKNLGGNHYKTGTNVVMDQSVYYSVAGSTVTWFLPNIYATADPTRAILK
jgi:hypothetical protein